MRFVKCLTQAELSFDDECEEINSGILSAVCLVVWWWLEECGSAEGELLWNEPVTVRLWQALATLANLSGDMWRLYRTSFIREEEEIASELPTIAELLFDFKKAGGENGDDYRTILDGFCLPENYLAKTFLLKLTLAHGGTKLEHGHQEVIGIKSQPMLVECEQTLVRLMRLRVLVKAICGLGEESPLTWDAKTGLFSAALMEDSHISEGTQRHSESPSPPSESPENLPKNHKYQSESPRHHSESDENEEFEVAEPSVKSHKESDEEVRSRRGRRKRYSEGDEAAPGGGTYAVVVGEDGEQREIRCNDALILNYNRHRMGRGKATR